MKKFFLLISGFFVCELIQAQYKNDNVLFKTIDPFELCKALDHSPGYLLLDVRSPGEFADTSSSALNYGHFKNAININIRELGQRIHGLDKYKNKPIFVYCSHSQRSRRAGKMLSDSGFTNINNVNGGITAFHYLSAIENNDCLQQLFQTNNKYKLISTPSLCNKLVKNPSSIFLLDVRSDSAFRHISKDEKENAMGIIAGSVNIPLNALKDKLSAIPKEKEIVVIDIYSHDASTAAATLTEKGYKNVNVLIEGIDRYVAMDHNAADCNIYQPSVEYNLLPVTRFSQWIKDKKEYTIVDVRSNAEYSNTHKDKYRNMGHIKNAISIPAKELDTRLEELNKFKNTPVVLYSFGAGNETFEAAALLNKKGFSDINVLVDGIFAIRWTAGNIADYGWLKDMVEDIPEENR